MLLNKQQAHSLLLSFGIARPVLSFFHFRLKLKRGIWQIYSRPPNLQQKESRKGELIKQYLVTSIVCFALSHYPSTTSNCRSPLLQWFFRLVTQLLSVVVCFQGFVLQVHQEVKCMLNLVNVWL